MKFSLIGPPNQAYGQGSSGEWIAGSDALIIWHAMPYQLSMAGHGIYEVALRRQQPGFSDTIDVGDLGQFRINVVTNWDDAGPLFVTKMKAAGIIVACKIMRAVADIDDDMEAAAAAVQGVAEEYGGTVMFSTLCGTGTQPHRDYPICMIDAYFRSKREQNK